MREFICQTKTSPCFDLAEHEQIANKGPAYIGLYSGMFKNDHRAKWVETMHTGSSNIRYFVSVSLHVLPFVFFPQC